MRKKITALLAIVLLSAQVTPAFAQYGPDGLCDPAQMRMCGEQIRKGTTYLYNKVSRFFSKAKRYVQNHSEELTDHMLFSEGFSALPSAQFHRATWEGRRAKQKEDFNEKRNQKTVVNTKTYEMKPAAKPAKKTPAKKK